jgi:cytochrome c peroxidase
MVGQAIAEFEFTLAFADAPIDRFARGQRSAMDDRQKRGALLFFGRARCVECHTVSGQSNEMFSDFEPHTIGVPQVAPVFGKGRGNVPFRDAQGKLVAHGNEDWGLFDTSADPADRYKFRTPPLRNVALQPAYFHNGAFTRLEDAVRHHLDAKTSARSYDPAKAGVAEDLHHNLGPVEPALQRLDPLLAEPIRLSESEFDDLIAFVRVSLTDDRAKPDNLRKLIPTTLPSGRPLPKFE